MEFILIELLPYLLILQRFLIRNKIPDVYPETEKIGKKTIGINRVNSQ